MLFHQDTLSFVSHQSWLHSLHVINILPVCSSLTRFIMYVLYLPNITSKMFNICTYSKFVNHSVTLPCTVHKFLNKTKLKWRFLMYLRAAARGDLPWVLEKEYLGCFNYIWKGWERCLIPFFITHILVLNRKQSKIFWKSTFISCFHQVLNTIMTLGMKSEFQDILRRKRSYMTLLAGILGIVIPSWFFWGLQSFALCFYPFSVIFSIK